MSTTIGAFHRDVMIVDAAKLAGMSQSELVALAKETNTIAVKAAKQTLLHAGQTGFVLLAIKDKITHGMFMSSVESLTGIHHRTASNYMNIARHYGNVSNLRGVRDALHFIKDASAQSGRTEDGLSAPDARPTQPTNGLVPARAATIEAETVEPETLVVEGIKNDDAPANTPSCWNIAREFIASLKALPPTQEWGAICDVMQYCNDRLAELDKLSTKP